jgi:crotonobetainyl-CoA:carnitine CoA-transferase CaiB-like acyl-CoA transferase
LGKPLAGIEVLDFSMFISGPYCSRMLAELGAKVIKIEPPTGDPLRALAPFHGPHSAYFGHLNAGKHSVVLDLKQDRDRSAALRLAARADVVVHNYRPGVMERLGLGYDVCRVTNQGLVYCAISGYGQHGPSATAPAFAQIIHAASGHDAVHMSYQADASRPPVTGVYFADVLGGLTAFSSITTALLQRTTTGRGDFILRGAGQPACATQRDRATPTVARQGRIRHRHPYDGSQLPRPRRRHRSTGPGR